MKTFILLTCIILSGLGSAAKGCTNFIVTRGASADGSTMISYTADSFYMYGELYHYPPAVYQEGAMRDVYEWDSGKFLGRIKEAGRTYNVIGNINEHQVVIGETTFGGREGLQDPQGILDYGSLMYIALQRAATAREAIKIMTDLVAEYGYCSEGESFSIGDKNEAWIMEMIGKGPGNKGAVWAAVRIPDGYVSGHANQARITRFPLQDPQNCLYAPDVITFAREKGFFSGQDEAFSFADAYNPLDFGGIRFCDARVWSLFRRVNSAMDRYIYYIKGESGERMPLYIKPDNKLSVHDVMQLMRDHYQGTELDMTVGVAAGPYGMPYRWRPLTWEYNGEKYFNERPISTPQTGFSFISQSRASLPDAVGGVLWFGVDDTFMTVYTPFYACMTEPPANFKQGVGSLGHFTWDSAFWVFNWVANFAYPKFSIIIDDIQKEQRRLEGLYLAEQSSVESTALALFKESEVQAKTFLTEYSHRRAQQTYDAWRRLGEHLLVKYMDGVKKDEYFKPVNIGYPDAFKQRMVEEAGAALKMIRVPGEVEREAADLVRAGEQAWCAKNFDDAHTAFEKALHLTPDNAEISAKLAKVRSMLEAIDRLHQELGDN